MRSKNFCCMDQAVIKLCVNKQKNTYKFINVSRPTKTFSFQLVQVVEYVLFPVLHQGLKETRHQCISLYSQKCKNSHTWKY